MYNDLKKCILYLTTALKKYILMQTWGNLFYKER